MKKYKLSDLFEKPVSGEWGTDIESGSEGVSVIRTTNFEANGTVNINNLVYRNIDIEKKSNKFLKKGDIIIEKSGGGPKQPVGRVVYFDLDENKYMTNNFTAYLRPKEQIVPRFGYYLLNFLYSRGVVLRFQNKTTGIINLKLSDYLKGVELIIPEKEIQNKIINLLDISSELIEKRKKQLEEMDNLIQSIFNKMFGDPNVIDKMKSVKLKEISKIMTGNTPSRKKKENYGSFIEWIKTDNMIDNQIVPSQASEYLSVEGADQGRIVNQDSILMACIAGSKKSIGKVCLLNRSVAINQQINAITCGNKINNKYLFYSLKFSKTRLEYYANDSMKKMISKSHLEDFEINFEPLESQLKFVSLIEEIEAQKSLMEKSLIEMENNFNALIQKAFKGELFPEE